jgi:hypothetical protein
VRSYADGVHVGTSGGQKAQIYAEILGLAVGQLVARGQEVVLDIPRFYDSLPRFAVDDVLDKSLRNALHALQVMTENGAILCARSFHPDIREVESRAEAIRNWLAAQTFGYSYPGLRTVLW